MTTPHQPPDGWAYGPTGHPLGGPPPTPHTNDRRPLTWEEAQDLADYESEVARGILHPPATITRMGRLTARRDLTTPTPDDLTRDELNHLAVFEAEQRQGFPHTPQQVTEAAALKARFDLQFPPPPTPQPTYRDDPTPSSGTTPWHVLAAVVLACLYALIITVTLFIVI